MTTVGVNVSDWLVTGQHGRFVMGERRSSDEPGRQVRSNTNDELFIQDKTDELTMWHKSDEAALTSHFDSGKVSPGFSSPAGLVGDWGSAGGMGMGIGRGMGWLWPSGLSGPRLDVGWPMITVQPAGLEHENTISCSMTACLKKALCWFYFQQQSTYRCCFNTDRQKVSYVTGFKAILSNLYNIWEFVSVAQKLKIKHTSDIHLTLLTLHLNNLMQFIIVFVFVYRR